MINDNAPGSRARRDIAKTVSAVLDTKFFKALCDPVRAEIIRRLVTIGAADVGTIAKTMTQDRSVISRHLAQLERAEILMSRKDGRRRLYDMAGPDIVTKLEDILAAVSPMRELCVPFGGRECNCAGKCECGRAAA
ncbi:ArsR/SmtB family transcription factor [Robiginitomaculum antarcticum]|uniref:ArsR/SmtB family transcription factor n=1 Tax=Robiginitomaculum antarcticum TaxID=437507 RepID=UPI00039D23B9|nr:metalloregulator ArsR/SmtB family transcription factor [Robiginitomaculum antarcticum]